jgi:hypothetical protein
MASKDISSNDNIQNIQYDELCHRHGYCVMKIKPNSNKQSHAPPHASQVHLISRNDKEPSKMTGFSTNEIKMPL